MNSPRRFAPVFAGLAAVLGLGLHASGCTDKKTNLPFVIPSTPDTVASANVTIFYSVEGVAGQSVQAIFNFSTDGGVNYRQCTPAPGQPPTPIVESHPWGAPYFFYWDSLTDLGPGFHRNVIVRALGLGGGAAGRGAQTNTFFVDNSDIFVQPRTPGPSIARSNVVASVLPDGTVYVAGGTQENGVVFPGEVYDPTNDSVVAASGMTQARVGVASALLTTGEVLMAGGTAVTTSAALAVADLYHRATDSTSLVPSGLAVPRYDAAAAPLPGGDAVVVGGVGPGGTPVAQVERYSGTAGRFSVVATSPLAAVQHPTATALPDGRVLVVGGADAGGQAVSTAFLFDPASSSVVTVGAMSVARVGHRATLLSSGKVLVTGGAQSLLPNAAPLATAEVFDPATLRFSGVHAMKLARAFHGQDLAGGRVLVVGGEGQGEPTGTAEEYDQDQDLWRFTSFAPIAHRSQAEVVAVGPGRAVVAGGGASIEVHHPLNLPPPEAWISLEATPRGRADHTATLLFGTDVLIVGGTTGITSATASVERFHGATNVFNPGFIADTVQARASLQTARARHAAVALPDGRVAVMGGRDVNGQLLGSIELYDPLQDVWTFSRVALSVPRLDARAIVLVTGDVLVVGGVDASGKPIQQTELYHSLWDGIDPGAALSVARTGFDLAETFSGSLLVAGGTGLDGTPSTAVEIYDPFNRTFLLAPSLQEGRSGLTLFPDSDSFSIVAAGGVGAGGTLADFEGYDPFTPASLAGTFPIDRARAFHTASQLDDRAVLMAGGSDGPLVLDASGVYFQPPFFVLTEPSKATVRPTITPRMNSPRRRHTATVLFDGRVLVVGGVDQRGVVVAGAETFVEPPAFFGLPFNPLQPAAGNGPPFPAWVTSFPPGEGYALNPLLVPTFPPGTPTFP